MPTDIPMELSRALAIIDHFRQIDAEMPTQMAHVFLAVATKPSLSTRDIMSTTELSQSSVSRACQTLSKYHRTGKAGFDLIESIADPRDTRVLLWGLTPKGRTLAANIVASMRGEKAASVTVETPRMKDVEVQLRKERLAGA